MNFSLQDFNELINENIRSLRMKKFIKLFFVFDHNHYYIVDLSLFIKDFVREYEFGILQMNYI